MIRKSAILAAALFSVALPGAFAADDVWNLDPMHSAAHFSIRHMMISNVSAAAPEADDLFRPSFRFACSPGSVLLRRGVSGRVGSILGFHESYWPLLIAHGHRMQPGARHVELESNLLAHERSRSL